MGNNISEEKKKKKKNIPFSQDYAKNFFRNKTLIIGGCLVLSTINMYRLIYLVGRVFANGPEDLGSDSGGVMPKTLKMALDTSLLNTQQYKVCIKSEVEQSRERSSALPYTLV